MGDKFEVDSVPLPDDRIVYDFATIWFQQWMPLPYFVLLIHNFNGIILHLNVLSILDIDGKKLLSNTFPPILTSFASYILIPHGSVMEAIPNFYSKSFESDTIWLDRYDFIGKITVKNRIIYSNEIQFLLMTILPSFIQAHGVPWWYHSFVSFGILLLLNVWIPVVDQHEYIVHV